MTKASFVKDDKTEKYELVPPEGGWGYIITAAISLIFIVTVVPVAAFGLVFGDFLASLGDQTGGTTLVNGLFNTVLSFTGLAANQLLQKYSCRRVGVFGAFLFFIGTFGTIFVTSLTQLLISFGIFQGMGFGLMMPSAFESFHGYFRRRQNVMMSICQAIIVAATITWPAIAKYLMENYGFRGTAAILSALSLNAFVGASTLQPAKWHMQKRIMELLTVQNQDDDGMKLKQLEKYKTVIEGEPFLEFPARSTKSPSIISLNGFALTAEQTQTVNKVGVWKSIAKSLDLALFKDPRYCNISCGLSLGLTSDLAFMSIMPFLLENYKFSASEITLFLTIYFISDFISRILLIVINATMTVWNRYVFLGGAIFSAIFRTAFVMNDTFWWTASVTAALGFLRALIQTPLPLVVSEQYGARFTTAFSLYMVVGGVVSLAVGLLTALVKNLTNSDVMVVHLLTVVYLLCAVPWSIEILITKVFRKQKLEGDT